MFHINQFTNTTFFFCNEPIWLAHSKKKLKLWRLAHYRKFYGKMECLPLWPTYIGVKGRTLRQIIMRCYSEHPWGTHWKLREHIENLLGTHWEVEKTLKKHVGNKRKNEKKTSHLMSTSTTPSFDYHYPSNDYNYRSICVHTSHWLTTSN
jgi:hypothetical protein